VNRRSVSALAAAALVLSAVGTAAAAGPWETAPLAGQGTGAGAVQVGTAAIHRTAGGVSARVTMTLPAEYVIPPLGGTSTGEHGNPEAFSLWVFVFFNPENCVGPCDGSDLMRPLDPANPQLNVVAGAYNAGGHLAAGTRLTIAGHVNQNSALFGGPNADAFGAALSQGFALEDAEIHLAVAPHGVLDPALLPAQITTPAGDPSFWWLAFFDPQP
jgi:hypothetical protein